MATVHNTIKAGPGACALFSGDPIELTSSWQDMGKSINTKNVDKMFVFLDVDINGSTNVRLKAMGQLSFNATNKYSLPIGTVGASDIKVEAEYYELNVDADQKVCVEINLKGLVPFVQLQVQDSNDSTGQIESAYVTFKK